MERYYSKLALLHRAVSCISFTSLLFLAVSFNFSIPVFAFPPSSFPSKKAGSPEDWARYQELQQMRIRVVASQLVKSLTPEEAKTAQNLRCFVSLEEDANAYMTSDGKLVIQKGMLDSIRNDDELALVMGHEIGHLVKQHYKKKIASTVLGYGLEIGMRAISRNWDSYMQMASPVARQSFSSIVANGFSEEYESTADNFGLNLMNQAGFDAIKGIDLYRRMFEKDGSWAFALIGYMATHPPTKLRYEKMEMIAKNFDKAKVVKGESLMSEELNALEVKLGIAAIRASASTDVHKIARTEEVDKNQGSYWLNKIFSPDHESSASVYEKLGIKSIGLVSKMEEAKHLSEGVFQKDIFPFSAGEVNWFMSLQPNRLDRSFDATFKKKYKALWYLPDGTLFSEQHFQSRDANFLKLSSRIELDPELRMLSIGKWRIMIFENGRIIDSREFQVTA